jgi:hypothetical protein
LDKGPDPILEIVTHPYALETIQARIDHAKVTNQPLVERPWWYRNKETDICYHDIYACLGWPTEIRSQASAEPGYAAIVGVVRPKTKKDLQNYNPINAKFHILAEVSSHHVPVLLEKCVEMRDRFGFRKYKDLLNVWYGDPERFLTPLALKNETLIKQYGDMAAILVSPPLDYYCPGIFDSYIRALHLCMQKGDPRLLFGEENYVINIINSEYDDKNPILLAIGGLVYNLLTECTWMDTVRESIFTIKDD